MRKLWLVFITYPWKVNCCWSQSPKPSVGEEDRIWLCKTSGSNFSPHSTWQRKTEIDEEECADINKSPCEEPEAVLVLLGRSCTWCTEGSFCVTQRWTYREGQTVNTNVMLDIQPKARVFVCLNSCSGQKKSENIHSRHVKELLGFLSSSRNSPLPFNFPCLLLVETLSDCILCQQFFTGEEILLSEDKLKFLSFLKRQKHQYRCT